MNYVLIIHEVKDYQVWKKIFDRSATIRKEAGEISFQLLKYQNETNRIVHFSAWSSLQKAKLFFQSPKLIEIRIEAGVKSPEFIYLERLEDGIL